MTGIIKLFEKNEIEDINNKIVSEQVRQLSEAIAYIAEGYRRRVVPARGSENDYDATLERIINAVRELLAGQYSELAAMLADISAKETGGIGHALSRERLRAVLARHGIKVSSLTILEKRGCGTEVHMIAKASSKHLPLSDEVAHIISKTMGIKLLPKEGCRGYLGRNFEHYVFRQQEKYLFRTGAVKASKNAGEPSGDNYSVFMPENGEAAILLSDGCGSGRQAYLESALVTSLMEKFLCCGFKGEGIISLVSSVLLMANESDSYSTLDLCLINLFDGTLKLAKSGASLTFIKHEDWVEAISEAGLPLGILPEIRPEMAERRLCQGDSVIVLSDGVLEGLPVKEKEALLQTMIRELPDLEPKEMAGAILMSSLRKSYYEPVDDMTVIVGRLELKQ